MQCHEIVLKADEPTLITLFNVFLCHDEHSLPFYLSKIPRACQHRLEGAPRKVTFARKPRPRGKPSRTEDTSRCK